MAPLAAALLAVLLQVPAEPAAAAPAPERVEAELGGGARLLMELRQGAEQAELVLAWRAGWLEDSPAAGTAARALRPCTAELAADALQEEAGRRGTPFTFEVGPDLTVLRAGGPPDAVVWLFEQVGAWLEQAPYTVAVEVAPDAPTQPADDLRRRFAPALWPAGFPHARAVPHGAVAVGEQVAQHRRRLGPNGLVIGLRGTFERDATAQRLADALAGAPAATAPLGPFGVEPRAPDGLEPWIAPDAAAKRMRIACIWPGPRPTDPLEPAATLWRYAIGGERLAAAVRDLRARVVLERGSDARADRADPFVLALEVAPERAGDALIALLDVCGRALEGEPPTEAELAPFLREATAMAEGVENLRDGGLDLAVRHAALGLAPARFEARLAALAEVEPEAVAEAGRAFASPVRGVIALHGPADAALRALDELRAARAGREGADEPALALAAPRWLGAPSSSADGAARADQLLGALGGREPWAALAHLAVGTRLVVETQGRRATIESQQWRSFDGLRLRAEQHVGATRAATVLDASGGLHAPSGWRVTTTSVAPLDATTLAATLAAERRALVRVAARLARGELAATVDATGKLVLADELGELLALELGADGRPVRGEWRDGAAVRSIEYTSWAESGGLAYAERYVLHGDTPLDYEVVRFQPEPELPERAFAPPL